MADRKAVNKYYPPDWDPKKGSLNKYHNSHPLRERARKLDQGILVIRFEAPWNFWCDGCNSHIGRGVRWNAEKKKVGMYYSTPIYQFEMKCHLCPNKFIFKTDPKNCDYVITEGAHRKTETWKPDDTETIDVPDDEEKQRRATNPMYRLEHEASDKAKAKTHAPRIVRLMELKEATSGRDYDSNSMLRKQFRMERKKRKQQEKKDNNLKERIGLDMTLVEEHKDDIQTAQAIKFRKTGRVRDPRRKVLKESIFDGKAKPTKRFAKVASWKPHEPNITKLVSYDSD